MHRYQQDRKITEIISPRYTDADKTPNWSHKTLLPKATPTAQIVRDIHGITTPISPEYTNSPVDKGAMYVQPGIRVH
jgi:hypothetical protein